MSRDKQALRVWENSAQATALAYKVCPLGTVSPLTLTLTRLHHRHFFLLKIQFFSGGAKLTKKTQLWRAGSVSQISAQRRKPLENGLNFQEEETSVYHLTLKVWAPHKPITQPYRDQECSVGGFCGSSSHSQLEGFVALPATAPATALTHKTQTQPTSSLFPRRDCNSTSIQPDYSSVQLDNQGGRLLGSKLGQGEGQPK